MPTQNISSDELRAWLDQRRALILLDTGLADDFAAQHLPGARNACVFEVDFLDQVRALRGLEAGGSLLTTPIVVYGTSERSLASTTAAEKLAAAGFSTLFNFRGGLAAWRMSGGTVEGTGSASEPAPPPDKTYTVDPQESSVEWIGRSLGGRHQGTLALLPGGTFTLRGGRVVTGIFDLDMASIRDTDLTDDALRQVLHHHLASEDFFDVARYPRASFQFERADEIPGSTQGEPNYHVRGKFLLKGVTNPLDFPAMIGRSPSGDGSLVARANFDLDRTRWNVLYGSGKFYEKLGRHLVSDLVTLDLKIVAR